MNTHSTALNNASAEATTSDRILQTALAAWRQGNFVEVVDQLDDQFTFTDHALGLEFKDKGRLTEFLARIGELFPDSERRDNTIFYSGDRAISEWTLNKSTRSNGNPNGRNSTVRLKTRCVTGRRRKINCVKSHRIFVYTQTLLRLIPRAAMRDDRVVGRKPSSSAAPPFP